MLKANGNQSPRVALLVAAALLVSLTLQPTYAQRYPVTRMQYLGQANVDGRADHDNITVNGVFRAIQIRVERGPIEFDHVIVHFASGQAQEIPVRSRIPAGGSTRVIDLPGERRAIASVEFYYARANFREHKPKVRLFGMR